MAWAEKMTQQRGFQWGRWLDTSGSIRTSSGAHQAAVQEPLFPKAVLSSPQPLGQVRSLCLWLGHGQFCGVSLSFFSSSFLKTNNSSKSGWLHPLHAKGSQRDVMERWEAPREELSRICSQGWNPGKGKWRWCFLPSPGYCENPGPMNYALTTQKAPQRTSSIPPILLSIQWKGIAGRL